MAVEGNPNWLQVGFYGGYSDDKFLGIQKSFQYAKGVEIRKNPSSLKLAYAAEKVSSTTITVLVNAMVTIKSTGDLIAFGNSGKIYRKPYGSSTWTNVYTDSGADHILNGFEYNDYLYWCTYNKLHRVAVSAIDSDWSGSVTEDYKSFTNGNTNAHPMIEINNNLYIGDGKNLGELDNLGTYTGTKLSIFADEEIRALTYNGNTLRIWSRKSTFSDYGVQYFWDGLSADWNDRVMWDGLIIHSAFNMGGIDFVLAGRRPILFASSGYEKKPLIRFPLVADSQQCFFSPNSMTLHDALLCIGAAQSGTNSVGRGVWTYGKFTNNYPDSLNFDYPTSNDNTTDIVGCVHQNNGELYFSWSNAGGTTFGIDKVNTAKYRATGELVSRVMYGSEAGQQKDIQRFRLAFKNLAAGEKIQMFVRKNLASVWPDDPELDVDYADTADRSIYWKEKDVPASIGDFNFIEEKFVLTAGTDQATTPELIEAGMVFSQDVNKPT